MKNMQAKETLHITGIFSVHKMHFLINKYADKVLRENSGISFSQFFILVAVLQKKGISQSEIAQYIGITEAAVSKQIKSLYLNDFIARKASQKNQTILTIKGQKIVETSYRVVENSFKKIFGVKFDAQKNQIEKTVSQMLPLLEKALEK